MLFLGAFYSLPAQLSDCEPYFSTTLLEVNSIRARIGTPNVFFKNWGDAGFAVPAQDSIHSIYAHNDWIGGLTADGQVHLAAGTYNSGGASDFFTGPLRNDGYGGTSEEVCNEFLELYRAERVDAIIHQEYYDRIALVANGSDPSILTMAPFENGYEPPQYFYDWPAHNTNPSYEYYLAPFYDRDMDGNYDPDNGDYPGFDIAGPCSCEQPDLNNPEQLQGHEAIWQVYNDSGLHTETGGEPMEIEIHCSSFGFNTCSTLDETIFQRKRIINRSSNTYHDTYIGQWVDTDLGCPTDDYVGSDLTRGLAYTYNGDADDFDCNGVQGYGQNPPMLSFQFLAGPYQDADDLDNPLTSSVEDALDSLGITYTGLGMGYGDGIIDNERMKMRRFTSYQRGSQTGTIINGEPAIAQEFYHYLSGRWRNNSPVTYGGNGITGSVPASFMFPGNSDPLGFSTAAEVPNEYWSESSEGNEPGDRRLLPITGPFTFEPGEVQEIVTAFNWTKGYGDEELTFNTMRIESDYIQQQFEYCFQLVDDLTPIDEFTYNQNRNKVTFSLPYYYSYDAEWTFGDGYYGTGLNAAHTYSDMGNYEVCVTVYSCNGPEEICQQVSITALDLQEIATDLPIVLYPNPTETQLFIHSARIGTEIHQVLIYDVEGRLMQEEYWKQDKEFITLNYNIDRGFYTAKIIYVDGLEKSASFLKR